MLTSGCAPPLVEDWCLCGMEWVDRKVYEHGFWKSSEECKAELDSEVLETAEGGQLKDGMIEDNDGEKHMQKSLSTGDQIKCWVRIFRCTINISGTVDGLTWVDGTRERSRANSLRSWWPPCQMVYRIPGSSVFIYKDFY